VQGPVIFELILLVIALAVNIFLAALVYINNPKSATNRILSLLCLITSIWLIVLDVSIDKSLGGSSLTWIRLSLFLGVPQILLFYLLAKTIPHRTPQIKQPELIALFVLSVLVMIDVVSPYTFTSVAIVNNSPMPVPGPGIALFLSFAVSLSLTAGYTLWRRYKKSVAVERQQLSFVSFGIIVMLGLIIATILMPVVFFGISAFIPFAPLYALVFLGSTTYAIVKHRLFNIRAVVARSAAYVLLLAALAGGYAMALILLKNIFFPTQRSSLAQDASSIVLALVLAYTFQPLRQYFEKITGRIFYRNSYDSQTVLSNLSRILVSELYLDSILKRSLEQLCGSVYIQSARIIIFDQGKIYRTDDYGAIPIKDISLAKLVKLRQPMLVADELPEGEHRRLMEESGVRVLVTLHTKDEFVGYLLLGDKLSGDIYSSQDTKLLEIVSKQLVVAIINAKSYTKIQEFNETLQERVERATARLRRANAHLRELDVAKDEFISMASHQLRTPLTTIKGYLSMLEDGDAGEISGEQREFVDYAFSSSERMVHLISDLLNVSRLTTGKFMIEYEPTDVVALVEDEIRQLRNHAKAKGLEIKFDPPATELPKAEIDEGKTRQVVMNFIDNALYYTPKGAVVVTLDRVKDKIRLEVKDTGIGVPKAAREKLFTKFFRAGNAQMVRPDGTGLGLYLAKRVIEDQGGTIIFDSEEGKGSTFGFELPIKAKGGAKRNAKQ
jgi:signal transduction histidine kinase